jgi:hypothetical protein
VFGVLRLQQLAELVREREHAPLAVLRAAGVEPNLSRVEVHLSPLQAGDFPAPPASQVHERDQRPQVVG